jgi:hypothetical protein
MPEASRSRRRVSPALRRSHLVNTTHFHLSTARGPPQIAGKSHRCPRVARNVCQCFVGRGNELTGMTCVLEKVMPAGLITSLTIIAVLCGTSPITRRACCISTAGYYHRAQWPFG